MAFLSVRASYILKAAENQILNMKTFNEQFSKLASHCYQKRRYSNKHSNLMEFYYCNKYHTLHEGTRLHGTKHCKWFKSRISTVPPAPESESNITHLDQENGQEEQKQIDFDLHRQDGAVDGDEQGELVSYHGHIPVLVKETLSALSPKENQLVVDMTFGGGGHARHIMKSATNLNYIAADRDPVAFKKAVEFSTNFRDDKVVPILSKFSELASQLLRLGIEPGSVDAFFMDLGASSMQFDSPERGFSLSRDGPLDMRMDGQRFPDSPTAADVINALNPDDLGEILKKYGEESHATKIAHAIVEARYAFGNFSRTSQLANIIKAVFDSSFRHDKLHRHAHVATKTFQALRIFVNDELNEIHNGLEVARHFLRTGGRCVTISFHSLEDRIIKRHFHDINIDENPNISLRQHLRNASVSYDIHEIKENYLSGPWKPLSRKIIEATEEEIAMNPRARSAKLRAAIKAEKS